VNFRYLIIVACSFVAGSCGEREPTAEHGELQSQLNQEPVVVYASYADETYLPTLFTGFTRDTGIRVTVRYGTSESIVDDVIGKRGSPPADLLLTANVTGVWRAADEGALRPLGSDIVNERVPAQLRDPDGYWTAVSLRTAQIIFDTQALSAAAVGSYEDLANPEFENKLCLTTSTLADNRSLIANLIKIHGVRPAAIIVRGWMRNLALPPFKSESDLMQAIAAGTCSVGIVSSSRTHLSSSQNEGSRVVASTPALGHIDVEAAGINRHAREPDAARQLLEWMLSVPVQQQHANATATLPVILSVAGKAEAWSRQLGESNVAAGAWLDEDAVKLAERAGYR